MIGRFAAVAVLGLSGLLGVAGCGTGQSAGGRSGSTGTGVDCSVTACTVTFQRGPTASVSILGVQAELVSVQDNQVTLRVGGQTISLPSDGTEQAADGLKLAVTSVTKVKVVVKISRG